MVHVEIDPRDVGMSGPCPVCEDDEHQVVHGALMPLDVKGGRIPPHEYGVCDACFLGQWQVFYGYPFEDRLNHRPSRQFAA